ncbi:flagellar protein [Bacillus solitudinis]|uniref:flagellar protein n=1 Tax=Bacillus solitudinis TaxID=2014074 RepID=UPI000C24C398|nr:flagellar protein [Bacillus solitudinis]
MSVVKELYFETKALNEFAGQPFPKEDDERDAFIEKLNADIEKREGLIEQVNVDDLNDGEKKLGQEIVKLNQVLNKRLEQIHQEIRANLTQLKEKKNTGRKYENPYEGPTTDGVFFDKRGV